MRNLFSKKLFSKLCMITFPKLSLGKDNLNVSETARSKFGRKTLFMLYIVTGCLLFAFRGKCMCKIKWFGRKA